MDSRTLKALDVGRSLVQIGPMNALHPHLETKRHVIWDWNGTLLSDIEHAVRTVNRLLSEEKLAPTNVEDYKRIFGFPVIDYYKVLGFDTSPEKFHELCERFNDYFYEGLHLCEMWPGARETLAHVHRSGKTQSLLSASEHNLLLSSVKKFQIEEFFHHVQGIADKKAGSKVDRGLQLMKKVGIAPEQTILIGDTDHDLEVGHALGIDVILVEHGHQCATRLRAIHHNVLKVL
jgi:phosphoglycolate phosphatase